MLNPASPVPLYHQLKERLAGEIRSGRWVPHQAIPPERELIALYGVSRTTVRQALAELVAEGFLYRLQGRGTYVAPAPVIHHTLNNLVGYVEELQLLGLDPQVAVIHLEQRVPPAETATALELPAGEAAVYLLRRVLVHEQPLLLLASWLPPAIGNRLDPSDLTSSNLPSLLEKQGFSPARGELTIGAVSLEQAEAALLGLPDGSPELVVTRILRTGEGRPLEWSRALYRPDRYQFTIALRRRRGTP